MLCKGTVSSGVLNTLWRDKNMGLKPMYLNCVNYSSALYRCHKIPELGLVSFSAVQDMKKNFLLVWAPRLNCCHTQSTNKWTMSSPNNFKFSFRIFGSKREETVDVKSMFYNVYCLCNFDRVQTCCPDWGRQDILQNVYGYTPQKTTCKITL